VWTLADVLVLIEALGPTSGGDSIFSVVQLVMREVVLEMRTQKASVPWQTTFLSCWRHCLWSGRNSTLQSEDCQQMGAHFWMIELAVVVGNEKGNVAVLASEETRTIASVQSHVVMLGRDDAVCCWQTCFVVVVPAV
jgi:hypothetical protein